MLFIYLCYSKLNIFWFGPLDKTSNFRKSPWTFSVFKILRTVFSCSPTYSTCMVSFSHSSTQSSLLVVGSLSKHTVLLRNQERAKLKACGFCGRSLYGHNPGQLPVKDTYICIQHLSQLWESLTINHTSQSANWKHSRTHYFASETLLPVQYLSFTQK